MDISFFSTSDNIILATTILTCICSIVNVTEEIYLVIEKRSKNFFDWNILKLRPLFMRNGHVARLSNIFLKNDSYPIVLLIRLVSTLGILLSFQYEIFQQVFILILLVSTYLTYIRNFFGQDGSDQMFLIILTCLTVIYLFRNNTYIVHISFYFISFQITLAYFVAGISKLFGKSWRSGKAIYDITNTLSFGDSTFSKALKENRLLIASLTWLVIIWEISFPMVFLDTKITLPLVLASGIIFHLLNSVIMGLNSFLYAFLSGYPALIFSVIRLNS